jgi:hypothetical protein
MLYSVSESRVCTVYTPQYTYVVVVKLACSFACTVQCSLVEACTYAFSNVAIGTIQHTIEQEEVWVCQQQAKKGYL